MLNATNISVFNVIASGDQSIFQLYLVPVKVINHSLTYTRGLTPQLTLGVANSATTAICKVKGRKSVQLATAVLGQ